MQDPILKNSLQKVGEGAGAVAQGVGAELKPQYQKKKKKNCRKRISHCLPSRRKKSSLCRQM
jgi:hypothetical protein